MISPLLRAGGKKRGVKRTMGVPPMHTGWKPVPPDWIPHQVRDDSGKAPLSLSNFVTF